MISLTEVIEVAADPTLADIRRLAKRAIQSLPPAAPDTVPVMDHELDCYTVALAYTLSRRLGLDVPALTA
jgi:hypothetical protein